MLVLQKRHSTYASICNMHFHGATVTAAASLADRREVILYSSTVLQLDASPCLLFLQAILDVLVPILGLLALHRIIEWAAERSRQAIQQRVADSSSNGSIAAALRCRSTTAAMVLLALRAPAAFVLPPLCFAYVLRSCLHITDLALHKYRLQLPQAVSVLAGQVSAQLVPLDAGLQVWCCSVCAMRFSHTA
jgi:hypothetical protein